MVVMTTLQVVNPLLTVRIIQIKMTKSRRQKERANVQFRLKGVYFDCEHLFPSTVRVLNLSESGLGFESAFLTTKAKEIKILEGKLSVGRAIIPVILRLVRSDTVTAGFEFIHLTELLKGAIRIFFEAELAGAHLEPLPQAQLDSPVRYQDSNGNHLEYETNERGKIKKLAIHILGNQVAWDQQTSKLNLILMEDTEPVGAFLRGQLVQFVRNIEGLNGGLKKQLEAILLGI
jgi:hypothetical protein